MIEGNGITIPLTTQAAPMDRRLLRDSHRPAIAIDYTEWNWLPVYSYSPKTRLWYGKIPGTTWGRLRPAAFYQRHDCLVWLQNEYRALYGIGPDVVVVCRYEPPVRRTRMSSAALADAFAQGTARLSAEERIIRRYYEALPGQLRGLNRVQRAALETELASLTNTLQALEQQRPVSPDTYLETQRQEHDPALAEPYDGEKTPEEMGGPWPERDHPMATMYVTVVQRPGERVFYAPWMWLQHGERPRHAYAHWVFATLKAAEAFCYDRGARWVVRQTSWEVQKQDQASPLPVYVDPAWTAWAETRQTFAPDVAEHPLAVGL
jgi:hypothetical protein